METPILKQIARFLQEQKRNKRRIVVFVCMAVVVCTGTVAALKMMGQALTKKERVLACNLKVHEHTENCYDDEGNIICGYADYAVHTHNDDCYDQDGRLVCTLPEIEKHEHTEECYKEEEKLICKQEESDGHIHTAECYTRQRGELLCPYSEHMHTDACYDEAGNRICGLEEHEHTEDCCEWDDVLTCGKEEGSGGHKHMDECYEVQKVLACGKLELHTHTDECYEKIDEDESDSEENRRLICGKLQLEEHVHSEENGCFKVAGPDDADEETQKEPEVQTEDAEASEETTAASEETLESKEPEPEQIYYCGKEEHTHSEECYDEAGKLICGRKEHTHSEKCLKADIRLKAETEEYLIVLEASREAFPDAEGELTLKSAKIPENSKEYKKSKELVEENTASEKPDEECPFEVTVEENGKEVPVTIFDETENEHYIYDIRVLEDGAEVQPAVPVRVSFMPKEEVSADSKNSEKVKVFHIDTEGNLVEDMDAAEDEEGRIVIDTPHFSTYDIAIEKDGKTEAIKGEKSYWETLADYLYYGEANNSRMKITLTADFVVDKSDESKSMQTMWLDNQRDLIIDLAGHKIICKQKMDRNALFVVGNGSRGSLIIMDSASAGKKDKIDIENPTPLSADQRYEGNVYNVENETGTYYLTKSDGSDVVTGKTAAATPDSPVGTAETTYKHTVNFNGVGAIENTEQADLEALIKIWGNNASVTIQGGRLTNLYGSAIVASGETQSELSLEGGYLFGNGQITAPENGGAVRFQPAKGNIAIKNDVVIAANKCTTNGGGIYADGKNDTVDVTIVMEGGYICGNSSGNNSGGVHIQDAQMTQNGGFITNNYVENGGGGITVYYGWMTMENGTIAANRAKWAGGGILASRIGHENLKGTFKIHGGVIASNKVNAEGGGIRLENGYLEIESKEPENYLVYITNNETSSQNGETRDWGGGGIFIAQDTGYMSAYESLVTENHADGFGGGVGGCSTGRLSISGTRGAAIYGNTADGTGLSGGGSSKNEDHAAHADKEIFNNKEKNYQDIFSALGCRVERKMLGNVEANWKGSCDGKIIDRDSDDVIASSKLLGLTAGPKSEEDIGTIRGLAKVFISGNKSGTHGAGIMCNGLLILGERKTLLYDENLSIDFIKVLKDTDGMNIPLLNGQFQFELVEVKGGKKEVIARASNTAQSTENNKTNVNLIVDYKFPEGFDGSEKMTNELTEKVLGEKHYELREVQGKDENIDYSKVIYKIDLEVKLGQKEVVMGAEKETCYWLYVDSIEVTTPSQSDSVPKIDISQGDYGGGTAYKGHHISMKGEAAFVNTTRKQMVEFTIRKTDDKNKPLSYVEFHLTEINGEGTKTGDFKILDTFESGEIKVSLPAEDKRYVLEEKIPDGYVDAGPWIIQTGENQEVSVYLARKETDGTYSPTETALEWDGESGSTIPVFHITNTPETYELPETGGNGLTAFGVSGVVIMLSAVIYQACYLKRKRHGRRGM